jgi:hypothetical protein
VFPEIVAKEKTFNPEIEVADIHAVFTDLADLSEISSSQRGWV